MNCVEAQGELPLFVGGDLESPGRERVERHLLACLVCRAAMVRAESARSALLAEFERSAAGFQKSSTWPKLRDQLRAEGLIQSSSLPEGWPRAAREFEPSASLPVKQPTSRLLRFAQWSAAAAALFLLGTWAGRFATDLNPMRPDVLSPDLVRSGGAGEDRSEGRDGSLEGGVALSPSTTHPSSRSGGSPLREVLSTDEAMWSSANEFVHQPLLTPFNAFAPSSDGNTASFSLPGRSDGFR